MHLSAKECIEVDAEKPVFSEMAIEKIVQLTRNDLSVTDNEDKDDDARDCEELTLEETQMCVRKSCEYFEQNSVIKSVIQHTVVLYIVIVEVNGKKKVQINISLYFVSKEMR
jgi:hypothetical protein